MLVHLLVSCFALPLSCPSTEQVSLGALASRVHTYAERPITVCGTFWKRSETQPSECIFWAGPGSRFSIYLDASRLGQITDNQRACITGIARRRDGIPVAEVLARNIVESFSPDGMQWSDYVFFPVSTCNKRLSPVE